MNTAIIVAAGSGLRFSPDKSKQFVDILGKPLIVHTLDRFESCPVIDEIILVMSEEGTREFSRISGGYTLSKLRAIVKGGKTRAESVRNGLDAINGESADIVAVHDGARPLVSVEEITRTIEKAAETGAACLVAPVTDTIKEIDGTYISCTIDRTHLRRALTPQAFRSDLIRKAFAGCDLSDAVTDECYLVEKLGVRIAVVEGSAENIKITHRNDIVLAEAILNSRVKR
jgi:2-C-methyl-D-erythritol 4-phosphate cytidylyltransferase